MQSGPAPATPGPATSVAASYLSRSLGRESAPGVPGVRAQSKETPLPGSAASPAPSAPAAKPAAPVGLAGPASAAPGGQVGIGGAAPSAVPLPAAVAISRQAQDRLVADLREEVAGLERKIHELSSGAGQTRGNVDTVQKEQLRSKDERIKKLKEELQAAREQERENVREVPKRVADLEEEHARLRLELQEARGAGDGTEIGVLAQQVKSAEEAQKRLLSQLKVLEANPFISKMDDRKEMVKKVSDLEAQLKAKNAEREKQFEANHEVRTAAQGVRQERSQLELKQAELQKRNAQLEEAIDTQAKEIQRIEHEMRLMRERLPSDQQEALERALGSLVADQPAAFARSTTALLLQDTRASPALVPTAKDLVPSTEQADFMDKVLQRLRQEQKQLENQIMALRSDIARQAVFSRDLKALHSQELEDVRQKAHSHLVDREKWQRIAASHLQSIQDLQKRIAALDSLGSGLTDQRDEASSDGFSELSELDGYENALDIVLGKGEVDSTTAASLDPAGGSGPEMVQTVVCLEMRGFDAACSEVGKGLEPAYNSLVSFGPFIVDDALLDLISTSSLLLEVRGALPGQQEQSLLGRGSLPLSQLLSLAPSGRRQRPASAVVSLCDKDDAAIVVARVRLKARMRYSISDMLEDYEHRSKVRLQDEQKLKRDLDSKLLETARTLCVQLRRISGLPPAPRQQPNHLRPYIFYQLPGHEPHFTRTGQGPHPVFDDTHAMIMRVDMSLNRWVQQGSSVHIIAFDDSPDSVASGGRHTEESLGVLGEVRVSLWPLLHNAHAVVEGPFTLKKDLSDPASAPAGFLEASIYWQEFGSPPSASSTAQAQAASAGGDGPVAPPKTQWAVPSRGMEDLEFQAVMGRLVRRLVAKGVKTVEFAFDHFDVRKVGAIQRQDFLDGVTQMGLGLSDDELIRLFARLDADGDGTLVLAEFRAALSQCTQADAPQRAEEVWVKEIFDRIRESMERRKDLSLQDMFKQLTEGQPGMDYMRFCQLLRAFRPDLHDQHLERLWLTVDKDRSGHLSFDEFADTFAKPQALQQSAANNGMTDEYFCILSGRLLRKLRAQGFQTIEQVVTAFDRDRDGHVSRQELDEALAANGLGLSQFERGQFAARIDADGDGRITAAELDTAFRMADAVHGQAEKRALDIFERIRAAISRSGAAPAQVFTQLCFNQGVMQRSEFDAFVLKFEPGLDAALSKLMWQLVDKNLDGCLEYQEFQQIFAPTQLQQQQMQYQQQQQQQTMSQQASAAQPAFYAPGATALPASTQPGMSEEHFRIVTGRLLRRLLSQNYQTVEQVIRRFDQDGDGHISRSEMEQVMAIEAPNLSHFERQQFVARMDADGDGRITANELQAAFTTADSSHSEMEQRCEAVFKRIREAMARSQHPLGQIFSSLCKGGQYMLQADFEDMAKRFEQGLDPQSCQLMWQLLDKNNDGALVYEEFARYFAPRVQDAGAMAPAQAAPAVSPVAAPASPVTVGAPQHAAGTVVTQPAPVTAQASRNHQLASRVQQLAAHHNVTVLDLLKHLDANGDGGLSADEFANGLIHYGIGEDRMELKKFFTLIPGGTLGRVAIMKVADHCVAHAQQPASPVAAAPAVAATTVAHQPMRAPATLPAQAALAARPIAQAQQPATVAGQAPGVRATTMTAGRPNAVAKAASQAAQASTSPRQQASDVLTRIKGALGRLDPISQVEDVYSRSMRSSKGVLTRTDFDQFVKNFQKTLTQDVLANVWDLMGQNAGSQVLPFAAFCEQFCPNALEKSAPSLASGKEVEAYLHRLHRWLQGRGMTVQKAFGPYDTGGRAALLFDDFIRACKGNQLPLARIEIERICFRLSPEGMVSFANLEAAVAGCASVPEASWAQQLLLSINAHAAQAGVSLEAAFAAKRKDAIALSDVQTEFVKYLSIDKDQWATLASFLDKQSDGQVLWRDFLKWAGVVR